VTAPLVERIVGQRCETAAAVEVSEQRPIRPQILEGVRDAMHEFASNMDYNRRKMSEEIQVTGQKMQDTLDAFREVDAALAKQFDEER